MIRFFIGLCFSLVYRSVRSVKPSFDFSLKMTSTNLVEEEQIQNGIDNSDDDDEIGETGKTDDQSEVKAKKKRKKKKKTKGTMNGFEKNISLLILYLLAETTTNGDHIQTDPIPNGTEAIANLSLQQDGKEKIL
jgi:hypothetical protein